jgi:hypothetical protein
MMKRNAKVSMHVEPKQGRRWPVFGVQRGKNTAFTEINHKHHKISEFLDFLPVFNFGWL